MRSTLAFAALAGCALVVGGGPISSAHAVTYNLTVESNGYDAGVGPSFGTVDVTQSGSTLHFDVEVAPSYVVHTGNDSKPSFAFHLSSNTGTIANINPGGGATGFTAISGNGPFSNGSFGGFNYGLNCGNQGGGVGCGGSLIFDVLNAGSLLAGTNSVSNAIIYFVVDIFSATTGLTGAVAATIGRNDQDPPSPVPLPAAVWLMGTVLLGSAGIRRWRNRKSRAVPA